MQEILYIQEFYYYIIALLLFCMAFSLISYWDSAWRKVINVVVFLFAGFAVYYLGSRESNIGIDTSNYKYTFYLYEYAKAFTFRKDFLFDFLTYIFAKTTTFNNLLIFCAFIYVFGAWYGFRKIFSTNVYLSFLMFIISPYFFQMGINVMRSGMAASLFLVAIGFYYKKQSKWKVILFLVMSLLIHLSMVWPLLMFFVAYFIRKTHFLFLIWLGSIILGLLKIDILSGIISQLGILGERFMIYTKTNEEYGTWSNFLIFGVFPVLFGLYNIFLRNYKEKFYIHLMNAYILIHIPYIILINSEFALRMGYLAEFMMPIILLYPLLVTPSINIKFSKFKLSFLFLILFLIKAYKILEVTT